MALRTLLLVSAGLLLADGAPQWGGAVDFHDSLLPNHGANFPSHDLPFNSEQHTAAFAQHENFPGYLAPSFAPQAPIMAVAILNGKEVKGNVLFLQPRPGGPVLISGNITGLTEGEHGFHIHEKGDISQGCASMGPHFNPFNFPHGAPTDPDRHAGDLGSIKADKDGKVSLQISDHVLALDGPFTILGRGVVVHEKADDLGRGDNAESVKTGNAGARIACGIIGRY